MAFGYQSQLGVANGVPGGSNVISVVINAAASADNLITGVSGKKIKVLSYILSSNTSTHTFKFEDGATDYTGDLKVGIGPVVAPYNEYGWFTVATGLGLDYTTGGSTPLVDGVLTYILVD